MNYRSSTNYVKRCINKFSSKNELLDLAALSFPIKVDENTWIDITLSKAITNQPVPSEFHIQDRSLIVCIGRQLESHLTYEYVDREEKSDEAPIPLTATSYPLLRYGHWHSDVEARGIYVPVCAISGKSVQAKSSENVIEFEIDSEKIGYASYWNNYWRPSHPMQLLSLYGTYTILKQTDYSKWIPSISKETKYFYTCNAKILKAEDSFREFETQEINFIISNLD